MLNFFFESAGPTSHPHPHHTVVSRHGIQWSPDTVSALSADSDSEEVIWKKGALLSERRLPLLLFWHW